MPDHQPLDCIRRMTELARAGQVVTVEFWQHESHVQAWTFDTLAEMQKDTRPTFGSSQDEIELVASLRELCAALGCDDNSQAMEGPINNLILKMLLEQLMQWLTDFVESGQFMELIRKLIDNVQT